MIINVTQKHIDRAIATQCRICGNCPVSLAVRDVFPGKVVLTGLQRIFVEDKESAVSDNVFNFIWDFDNGVTVHPFSFELTL